MSRMTKPCDTTNMKFLVLFGLFGLMDAASFTMQHAKLQPHEMDTPWIGSHTLKFTPNPFLREGRSSGPIVVAAASVESPVVLDPEDNVPAATSINSTTVPPLQLTNFAVNSHNSSSSTTALTTTTSPKVFKRRRVKKTRRKVKGRRRHPIFRRPSQLRKSQNKGLTTTTTTTTTSTSTTTTTEAPAEADITIDTYESPRASSAEVNNILIEPTSSTKAASFSQNDVGDNIQEDLRLSNINFLPIDQVSTNPTIARMFQTVAESKIKFPSVSITTPEPIRPEIIYPRYHSAPIDFSLAAHPERINPNYFRNIILKTMMDKLARVGVVTYAPRVIHRG